MIRSNLHIQDQLEVHELLVFMQVLGHVQLESSQSSFQLSHTGLSILDSQLPTLLDISDGSLQGSALAFEALELSLESADVSVHLRNLHFHVMHVIPLLPSQCLQLLILGLIQHLSLGLAVVGLISATMSSRSREKLLSMDTPQTAPWTCRRSGTAAHESPLHTAAYRS